MSQIKVIAVNRFGTLGNPIIISETNDSRSSGFPQMELFKNELYFAWTNTSKKQKKIDLARIKL